MGSRIGHQLWNYTSTTKEIVDFDPESGQIGTNSPIWGQKSDINCGIRLLPLKRLLIFDPQSGQIDSRIAPIWGQESVISCGIILLPLKRLLIFDPESGPYL